MRRSESLSGDTSSLESATIRSPQTQRVRAYKGASDDEVVPDDSSDDLRLDSGEDVKSMDSHHESIGQEESDAEGADPQGSSSNSFYLVLTN